MLPYSREVLFSLFGELNTRFALPQLAALLLALLLAFQTLRPAAAGPRRMLAMAALLWGGAAYCFYFRIFAPINFLAPVYAGLAAVQGVAFLGCAALPRRFHHRAPAPRPSLVAPLVLLALVWPLLDLASGPGWPALRGLGLHPAPLLLLTQALLLHAPPRLLLALSPIPIALSAVSAFEAYALNIHQDGLPLLAWIYTVAALLKRQSPA